MYHDILRYIVILQGRLPSSGRGFKDNTKENTVTNVCIETVKHLLLKCIDYYSPTAHSKTPQNPVFSLQLTVCVHSLQNWSTELILFNI